MGQDAMERNSKIELYLPQRSDFTGKFANSTSGLIGFSRPSRMGRPPPFGSLDGFRGSPELGAACPIHCVAIALAPRAVRDIACRIAISVLNGCAPTVTVADTPFPSRLGYSTDIRRQALTWPR